MKQIEAFFWGIPAALGALFIQIILIVGVSILSVPSLKMEETFLTTTLLGIILAAVLEETFKYLVIAKKIDAISLEFSYLPNSILFGIGFFITEMSVGYLNNYSKLSQAEIIPLLGILSIHLITVQVIAFRIATKNPNKLNTIISTIFLATILHTIYNFFIFTKEILTIYISWTTILILILLTLANILRFKKHLAV
jgi:hypothetical protein